MPFDVRLMLDRHNVERARREQSQGKGRPIISAEFQGYRVVAVGSKITWGHWRTFEEFLLQYLRRVLGAEWGLAEQQKAEAEQHVILRWLNMANEQARSLTGSEGVIQIPKTGATTALLALAYNLYLLAHNVELQRALVKRLKHPDQFNGAYYETLVAAWFILAGFEVTLMNERDPLRRNCEFTAKAKDSGRSFSVEAKARQPGKENTDVGTQLWKALKKDADHDRIVFIDLNTPDEPSAALAESLSQAIRGREIGMTIDGAPAPAAYVVITNHPYHYNPESVGASRFLLAEGFKIADFGTVAFSSLIDAFKAEQKHRDVLAVLKAFEHYQIPSTFDGELPEIAYGRAERRWLLEQEYDLSRFGLPSKGVLRHALVDETVGKVTLAFTVPTGEIRMFSDSLSEPELTAYRRHPESFFGVPVQQTQKVENPLELFKFFYNSYKSTPRARMLEFFKGAGDLDRLSTLDDAELRLEFCNRHALAVTFGELRGEETDVQPHGGDARNCIELVQCGAPFGNSLMTLRFSRPSTSSTEA